MKRHFQCAADPTMIREWSENDPSMIRPWNRQSATRLATEVTFHAHHEHFVLKNTTFRAPAIIPNFTEYCACHEKWHSNFTKYCACHEKRISWLILVTHETLFTMRGATSVIVQTHQILRLPRKMNLMIDPWHKWNVIFTMRGATCVIVQTHQILRLPRKMTVPNLKEICWKRMKRHFQCAADPRMIRPWSEHGPSMIRPWNRQSATRLATEVTFHAHHEHFVLKNTTFRAPAIIPNFTEYCACHEKWHIELHQILRLPRKKNLMIDPCHTWNAIYNARSNKCHCPNSPNTAPATQNESHDWSLTQMKRYIYNARSNMRHSPNSPNTAPATKNDRPESQRNSLKTDETSFPMRGPRMIRPWSEHDPSIVRPWSDHETVSPQPASQPRLPFTPTTSILYWKIQHFALRLSFQISPNTAPATKSDTWTSPNILRPPRKKNLMIDPCHTWNAIYNARSNKCHCPNSPNTAPATKNDRPESQRNSLKTDETSFPMRGRSENDPTMIRAWSEHDPTMKPSVRNPPRNRGTTSILYWKIQHFALRLSFQISPNTAPATKSDTWTSPNTAPATKSDTCTSPNTSPATKSDTSTSPNTAPAMKIELLLDWAMTWLSYDLTELWLDWAVTWLSYYWAVTWLSYDLTELWRDWAVTWLSCDVIEL